MEKDIDKIESLEISIPCVDGSDQVIHAMHSQLSPFQGSIYITCTEIFVPKDAPDGALSIVISRKSGAELMVRSQVDYIQLTAVFNGEGLPMPKISPQSETAAVADKLLHATGQLPAYTYKRSSQMLPN